MKDSIGEKQTTQTGMNPSPEGLAPIQSERLVQKWYVWVTILIVVFGIGLFIVSPLRAPAEQKAPRVVTPPYESQLPNQVVISTTPTSQVSQTVTYESEQAGYSFSHSKKWVLAKGDLAEECTVCLDAVTLSTDPNIVNNVNDRDIFVAVIIATRDDRYDTFEQFMEGGKYESRPKVLTNVKRTMVDGYPAVSTTYLPGGSLQQDIVTYHVLVQDKVYEISLWDTEETRKNLDENLKFFNEMVESFRFSY